MASVVSIGSYEDSSTIAATAYRETFIEPLLEAAGLVVQELDGPHANAAEALVAVQNPGVIYVTGASHGTCGAFTGSDGTPVFSIGDAAPGWAKGKVIHFLACSTAVLLGPDLVKPSRGGAAAYLGYTKDFSWPADNPPGTAAAFFSCDAEIERVLANKGTAGTAYEAALAKYDAQIAAWKASGDPTQGRMAAMMTLNRGALCGPDGSNEFGDPNATIL